MRQKRYKRKLYRLGKYSAVISIPKPWLDKRGLKAGDFVYVYERGNRLIIEPPKFPGEAIELRLPILEGLESYIEPIVEFLYTLGFNEVRLNLNSRSNGPPVIKLLGRVIPYLIASFREDSRSLDLKMDNVPKELDLVSSMSSQGRILSLLVRRVESLIDGDGESYEAVESSYEEFRRLNSLTLRAISSRREQGDFKLKMLEFLAIWFRVIGSVLFNMAKSVRGELPKARESDIYNLRIMLPSLEVLLSTISSLIEKPNLKKVREGAFSVQDLLRLLSNMLQREDNVTVFLAFLIGILTILVELLGDLYKLAAGYTMLANKTSSSTAPDTHGA